MELHKTPLTKEQLSALAEELDGIRKEITDDLGERDAKYIRKILAAVRYSSVLGRGLLWFCWLPIASWWLPFAFVLGSISLGISKILENMEAGHNIMHGQFDWMNDKKLNGKVYEWDCICTADNWRYTHNYLHHTYTNVLGKDHDIGYGFVRVFPEQRWHPMYLLQPLSAIIVALFFQWAVAIQNLRLEEVLFKPRTKTFRQLSKDVKPYLPKMGKEVFKDYILFPLLVGPFFFYVFFGNMIANIIRNIWSFFVIFCGHFPSDTKLFDKSVLEDESKGHWYYRQIVGSSNFHGSRLMHIMSGNLSYQIEHHLYPDLPANRYHEIAPRIREICARYNIPYDTGSLLKQSAEVLYAILKWSLPLGNTSKDYYQVEKPALK
ncbi:acyl-CoA desaturase [Neisseriaceae bacterium PsAf]|nr:acyl-CoA desaturase [Neisseriaceae bacterium PsAf]MCV2503094.1 acyl-CoA desaturase [Neisseriaceae bacterium]